MLVCDQALSCRKRKSLIEKHLALSDYHGFGPLREGLRGKHYACDGEVKTSVMKWLKEQSTEFYEAGIYALIHRWNITIERNGDIVEK